VNAWILSAALKVHVMAVGGPSSSKCGLDNGLAVAPTLVFWMGDHVFEKSVVPTGSQKIGHNN
jgi:hypothetical protein